MTTEATFCQLLHGDVYQIYLHRDQCRVWLCNGVSLIELRGVIQIVIDTPSLGRPRIKFDWALGSIESDNFRYIEHIPGATGETDAEFIVRLLREQPIVDLKRRSGVGAAKRLTNT